MHQDDVSTFTSADTDALTYGHCVRGNDREKWWGNTCADWVSYVAMPAAAHNHEHW